MDLALLLNFNIIANWDSFHIMPFSTTGYGVRKRNKKDNFSESHFETTLNRSLTT